MRLSLVFFTDFTSYFLVVVEFPKSPNQSSSNPVDFFSYFFYSFFFGSLSSKLKSLKKLSYQKNVLKVRVLTFLWVFVDVDLDFLPLFEGEINFITELLI